VAYLPTVGIIAVDVVTGNELWRNPDVGGTSSLALDGNVLYVHDGGGIIHALDIDNNGAELWQLPTAEGPGTVGFSSPVVTKDYVLVGGSTLEEIVPPAGGAIFKGFVLAANKDGSLAWRKHTVTDPEKGATIWSTVSADESLGVIYAATGNNHGPPAGTTSDAFLAIPMDGGDYKWTKQSVEGDIWMLGVGSPDYDFGANPIVFDYNDKKLVAGGNKGGDFWVLDRETGEILKQVNLGPGGASRGGFFISGAWDGKHLLAACNLATSTEPGSEQSSAAEAAVLFALQPETLDIVWSRQVKGPVFGPISVANGVGLFGKNMTLQAFNTETGEVLKEFATDGSIASAPAVSNGYVVFGSGMSWQGATSGTKYYALKVP
jgi:outer membrane protein assembly factor BamB